MAETASRVETTGGVETVARAEPAETASRVETTGGVETVARAEPAETASRPGPVEPDNSPADHRKAPRRRGEVLERAIFDATLAELDQVGYLNLSLERVAQRARTGNASLYRRWSSRAELVVEAIRYVVPDREEPPDTGTVRGDLLTLLRKMAARQAGPTGEVIRGVIAESLGNERVRAARARLASHRDQQVLEILRRGAARGEVRPGALTPEIAGVGPALLMSHFLLHGAPIPDRVVTGIVDQVLVVLISPRTRYG